jgi:hypothetical protein
VARDPAPLPDFSDRAVPERVLAAYQAAAAALDRSNPGCRLGWPLLAGIGKVESGHAYGGAVDRRGDTLSPILGPVLDGGPGVAAIRDTDDGRWDTDTEWDRAVGPMQFIPSSWVIHGVDGNRDDEANPNNLLDATLASAGYLCSGGGDLEVRKDRRTAVFSYNHSWDYVDLVLAWAEAYAGGTPVLTGTLLGYGGSADDRRTPVKGRGDGSGPPPSAAPPDGPVTVVPAGPGTTTGPGPAPSQPATSPGPGEPSAEPTREPGPSATPTREPGPSATPTRDPDPQPSQTPSESPSTSPSPDPCPSPSDSPSPTGSPAPSESPTPTPTPTPTESPTGDPSPSPSDTPTCGGT